MSLSPNDFHIDRKYVLNANVHYRLFGMFLCVGALVASLYGFELAVDAYLAIWAAIAVHHLFIAIADRRAARLDGDELDL